MQLNSDDLTQIEEYARSMVRDSSMIEPALDAIAELWYGPKPRFESTLDAARKFASTILPVTPLTAKRRAFEIGMQAEMWGE